MERQPEWTVSETDDRTRLVVKYDGKPIVNGMMDLADLVPALDAIRSTLVYACNDLNNGAAQARVLMTTEVREGSYEFAIVMAQMLVGNMLGTDVLNAVEIGKAVFGENGLLPLLKFLKGAPEKDVQEIKRGDGNVQFSIKGNNNTVIVVPPQSAQLYHRKYVRDRVWGAIQPVTKPGMKYVSFQPEDEKPELITPPEAEAFRPLPIEKLLEEDKFELVQEVVDVVKPALKEHKKWKLAIKDNVFGATMRDLGFQNAVLRREILFGAGDKLEVRLGVRKHKNKNPDYIVAEVLEVIRPNEQLRIFEDEAG